MNIDDEDRIVIAEYRGNKVRDLRHQDGEIHRISGAATHLAYPPQSQERRDVDRGMPSDRSVRIEPEDGRDSGVSAAQGNQMRTVIPRQLHQPDHVLGPQQITGAAVVK